MTPSSIKILEAKLSRFNKPTLKQFLVNEARYYQDRDLFKCPDCNGKGYHTVYHQSGPEDYDRDIEHCDTCDGKGKLTKPKYLKYRASQAYEDENSDYIPR